MKEMNVSILQKSTEMLTSGITMLKLTVNETLLPNANRPSQPQIQSSLKWESQGHTEFGCDQARNSSAHCALNYSPVQTNSVNHGTSRAGAHFHTCSPPGTQRCTSLVCSCLPLPLSSLQRLPSQLPTSQQRQHVGISFCFYF